MAVQLRGAVGRLRKLELVYIIICLCLQLVKDVAAADSLPQISHSSEKLKDFSHNKDNKSTNQQNSESNAKTLSRKSRATSATELSSVFSEDDIKPERTNGDFPEFETGSFNNEEKRKGISSVIPLPRIGRSRVDPNLIMPYPDSWLIPYLYKTQNEMNEIKAPVLVVDEDFVDNSEYFSEEESNEDPDIEDESILPDNDEFQLDSISERQVESNNTVIPYPRFGKRESVLSEKDSLSSNQNPTQRVKRATNSIIPQFRVGRSSQSNKVSKPITHSLYVLPNYRPGRSASVLEKYLKQDKNAKTGILPYPRPGRSNGENVKRQDYILPQPRVGRSVVESKEFEKLDMILKLNPSKIEKLTEELLKSDESKLFLIPYPRPGKRFFGTKPLPPNVNLQYKDKDSLPSDETGDKEQSVATFLVPYPRPGRSRSGTQSLIPNARFGKAASDNMLPLPGYGRSTMKNSKILLPYPRPGRSDSLTPNARFGRSDILPYPRPGRSSSSILPYPRIGRSGSVVPQMRVGKSSSSSSMIPQMRVGKSGSSDSMIPQMRVGKSSSSASMIPQMRVGKSASSIIPQMRVGKSASSIIPQMRVGKSDSSIIPQIRVGKSASSIIPQMRVGKSASSIIPQMRVGKSSNSFINNFAETDDDVLLPDMAELNVLDEQVDQLQESSDNHRNSQTDSNIFRSAVLIPAKKLKKHGGSNYMLPYPRPGRFV